MVARKVTDIYDEHLKDAGVTLPQFSLLRRLGREEEVNMNGFAKLAGLERTTLLRNMRPLQEAGFIQVSQDPSDARQKRIRLTARGRKVVAKAMPMWESAQTHIEEVLGSRRTAVLDDLAELLPALG